MAKYDFVNYKKFAAFIEHLLYEHRERFQAVITEGQLLARTSLQGSLDATDTVARSISTGLRVSWLQLSRFPREDQNTFEDVPLLLGIINESRHTLKDSRAMLKSLDI